MNRRRCERTWQAEAREDGRLGERDLTSFERHAAFCQDCTDEIASLRDITQKMAELPEPQRTELEHRRARQELLRRANERFLTDKPTAKPWRMWAFAGVACVWLGLVVATRLPTPTPRPRFDVIGMSKEAIWHVDTIDSTSHVKLQSGTAAFHVERLENETRFLVDMPDGHIEVRGTRFVVEVAAGKTRSVVVSEGKVWLDVPDFHGLLRAGERWPKNEMATNTPESNAETNAPLVVPNVSSSATSELAPNDGPPNVTPPNRLAHTAHAAPIGDADPPTEAPLPSTSASTMPKDEAGPRFAEAMAAFSAGEDARADQLFANFIRDFPRDGRAEDAMFLRAKARARRGDSAGAASIARDYLKAFPRGFRRPEAERLAGDGR